MLATIEHGSVNGLKGSDGLCFSVTHGAAIIMNKAGHGDKPAVQTP